MRKPTRVEMKLRRRRRFFRFTLLISVATIGIMFMLKSDFFNIDGFIVKNNYKITNENIINASSINVGENIFKINKDVAEKAILNLPYTKNIKIKRKLPRKIILDVEERVGALQAKSISTTLLVDIEGFVLEQLEDYNEDLPIIIGFDINNINLGENIFQSSDENEIIDFIMASNVAGLLIKSSSIDMTLLDNINILLNSGISVAFGTLDNVKYKLDYLNEILQDIEAKDLPCKMIIMNKGGNPILVLDDQSEG